MARRMHIAIKMMHRLRKTLRMLPLPWEDNLNDCYIVYSQHANPLLIGPIDCLY